MIFIFTVDICICEDIITLRCSSCGADIMIDTSKKLQATCFWCRNTLSINKQVPNGSVPDAILPFSITKEEARDLMNKFVEKRWFVTEKEVKGANNHLVNGSNFGEK